MLTERKSHTEKVTFLSQEASAGKLYRYFRNKHSRKRKQVKKP